jgi:hypothetical protein
MLKTTRGAAMGEFADMYLEESFDRYWSGDLDGYEDEDDSPIQLITCRRCRERGLQLLNTRNGWVLSGPDGRRHNCAAHLFKRYAQNDAG